jgi:hypothetical protein
MEIKHASWILLLAVLTFPAACSKDEDSGITQGEPTVKIMPLAMNNQWDFKVVRVDSLGDTLQSLAQSMIIIGDTSVSGTTWYQYQMGFSQSTGPFPMMANKNDGLWAAGPDAGDLPYMLAKYPASVGEIWTNASGSDTFSVEAVDLNITVPAGTYDCMKYVIHRPTGDSTHSYFAPGVGLVKQTFFANDRSEVRTELSGVTLN